MCFSPTASFTSAAVIATIGVATLRHVREPRMALLGAVPMLFALHQFTEGLVWLGLEGRISPWARDHATLTFTLYAQGLLPCLMPLAVTLAEPQDWRKRLLWALTAIGAVAALWDAYGLLTFPLRTFIDHNSIAYRNVMTGSLAVSLLYIAGTTGSLLLSSQKVLRWYGVANIIVLTIVEIVREQAFASVWCFYAALMSVLFYLMFRRQGGRRLVA